MTRKNKLSGTTYQTKTGCGNLYVTINEDVGNPIEVFATMGKAGGCAASQIESIARLISLSLRNKIQISDIVKQMIGIRCYSGVFVNNEEVLSCSDAIAKVLKKYIQEKK